jgi:Fur family zinc uptake transcriptional regulator
MLEGPVRYGDHDHPRPAPDAILAAAETLCAAKGLRLTPMRRKVLAVLSSTTRPLGAYDILEKIAAEDGERLAPIAVYRALDFLKEAELIHRIESRNAFIVCTHRHHAGELVVFLICEGCGTVEELASPSVRMTLIAAARAAGFRVRAPVLEVSGTCVHCAEAA